MPFTLRHTTTHAGKWVASWSSHLSVWFAIFCQLGCWWRRQRWNWWWGTFCGTVASSGLFLKEDCLGPAQLEEPKGPTQLGGKLVELKNFSIFHTTKIQSLCFHKSGSKVILVCSNKPRGPAVWWYQNNLISSPKLGVFKPLGGLCGTISPGTPLCFVCDM
jgi:hypothetical protein